MNQTRLVEYDRAAYMTGLPHRVRPGSGPPPHPTVVMIHGRHGNEDVPWVFSRTVPEQCLIIAPRAIEEEPEDPNSGEEGFSWLLPDSREWPKLEAFDPAVRALHDFVRALPDAYQADLARLYILGFSQGAAVAYATILNHPGLVQGVAGLVGFSPVVPDPIIERKPLATLPVHMAVGKEDERVPLEIARKCRDIIAKAGAELDYHEYQVGHKLNSRGLQNLKAWFSARINT